MTVLFLGCWAHAQQPRNVIEGFTQGTTYRIVYLHDTIKVPKKQIDSVLAVIDKSMSLYQSTSLISTFNKPTVSHIEMDEHLSKVVYRAFDFYRISEAKFDVTVKPLVALWGFSAERISSLPNQHTIDSVLAFVGMDKLMVQGSKLSKKEAQVSIDLDGIAQGYSVDVLAGFMDDRGIENYLVEIGGEIKTKGVKEGGQAFQVAIERPYSSGVDNFILNLQNCAVTTSGNYRKAFDFEGRKIHHHIDPFNGYPLQNPVASVTVIAKTAMDADAYDNVFMALSPTEGVELANSLDDVELYVIYKDEDGFKELFSEGFKKYLM